MPKYLIERRIPNASTLTDEELRSLSRQLVNALRRIGPQIQWLSSQVTGEALFCIYIAESEAQVRAHARAAGIPADRVSRIYKRIDPETGE